MLEKVLDIKQSLGHLEITPSEARMRIVQSTPLMSSKVQVKKHEFSFEAPSISRISIDFKALREDIGYRTIPSSISYYASKSKSKGSQGISKIVSRGLQALDNPEAEMIAESKDPMISSVNTTIAALPRVRPSIRFSKPKEFSSKLNGGKVSVDSRLNFDIRVDVSEVKVKVKNASLDIKLVPNKTGRVINAQV